MYATAKTPSSASTWASRKGGAMGWHGFLLLRFKFGTFMGVPSGGKHIPPPPHGRPDKGVPQGCLPRVFPPLLRRFYMRQRNGATVWLKKNPSSSKTPPSRTHRCDPPILGQVRRRGRRCANVAESCAGVAALRATNIRGSTICLVPVRHT